MQLNSDFSRRAVVHAGSMTWVSSPIAGVDRIMLDRVGGEVARASSLVRYRPHSRFSRHVHGGGEEFLVLEGVFQDEHGDFPAGSYVRNPPGTSHAPWSDAGCVIFVKLWQFDLEDRTQIEIRPGELAPAVAHPDACTDVVPLFRDAREEVRLEFWPPGAELEQRTQPGGLELFVLEGGFEESGTDFVKHSWLRLPPGAPLRARAGRTGVKLWAKYGHLLHAHQELPSTPSVAG